MLNATPLQRINTLAETLAAKRAKLDAIVTEIEDAHRATIRSTRARLRDAYNATATVQGELRAEVSAHPELFVKPRTITIHGFKIGYQKGKGKILIADEPRTVALIKKYMEAAVADTLIKVDETVVKNALGNLTTTDLKRLGIDITEATDEIVLKPVDGALDKLLDRQLEEATKEEA